MQNNAEEVFYLQRQHCSAADPQTGFNHSYHPRKSPFISLSSTWLPYRLYQNAWVCYWRGSVWKWSVRTSLLQEGGVFNEGVGGLMHRRRHKNQTQFPWFKISRTSVWFLIDSLISPQHINPQPASRNLFSAWIDHLRPEPFQTHYGTQSLTHLPKGLP